MSACISITSTMDASSTTSRLQSSGLSSPLAFDVDFEQPVDGLGLEAGRLGYSLGRAARRCTQQKLSALRRKDAQDRSDNCGLANARTAGHDQHLGRQCKPDCGDLACSERKIDTLLDPRQRLV